MILDGPINCDWFEADVQHGDTVIMDNKSSHRRAAARELIEDADAALLFIPPYISEFNPIEKYLLKTHGHAAKGLRTNGTASGT